MNDFTKVELEIIGQCFEKISHKKFMEDKNIQPVYLKIRSMIDNYCEHPVWEVNVIGFKCIGCNRMAYHNL